MISRGKSQNINSIADLYNEYKEPIYRYLFRLTSSRQIAEDLTQETFYQAIISIHRYKGDSKVSTWLYKIARHLYLNNQRGQIRKEKIEEKIIDQMKQEEYSAYTSLPERILENKIRQKEILQILQKLPEHYRSIILFKEIEKLSHDEIASIMGKTVATTKVTLFRAKEKFQEEYSNLRRGEE